MVYDLQINELVTFKIVSGIFLLYTLFSVVMKLVYGRIINIYT